MVSKEKRREQKRLANRRWMKKYPGRAAEVARRYRENHPEMAVRIWRKSQYGMTHEDFEIRLKKQNNRCMICKKLFVKIPNVDHCHVTGKTRDLLCSSCNSILGQAHDSEDILLSAIEYLRRHGAPNGKETPPVQSHSD